MKTNARPMRRRLGDESGNIGMIFAMMILPIVIVIGMWFDFGRGFSARTQMQAALDGAVLAGVSALRSVLVKGPELAMNEVNRRVPQEASP